MSYIKSLDEVKLIKEGGKKMGEILEELQEMVKPGMSAWEIDQKAEKLIKEAGGIPAFKGYRARQTDTPFPSTICASVNHELVHGIATKERILKDGDIFSIDIGMQYPTDQKGGGYFTDTALTIPVGNVPEETMQLISVTKKALEIGIEQCESGSTVASIGRAIEGYIKPQGYGIVHDLVGHGVGHAVHEEPRVPNYYDSELENWKLEPGVVIAIEPMITMGSHLVETAEDGWTISTKDKSLNAHFEHTIVITDSEPIVATRRPSEL